MKRNKLFNLHSLALAAIGVFLGRGAQAGTVLTFDTPPGGQGNNAILLTGFGSNAGASSDGVSVTAGGTPNIGLTWGFTAVAGGGGGGGNNVEWDFYNDSVWKGTQLNNSGVNNTGSGTAAHTLSFAPSGVAVQLNSFNLHGYYNSTETFDYNWFVKDGATTLANGSYSFTSDGTKNHLVNINYTGGLGQALSLEILRTGGTGSAFNVAVDDISFAQVVPEPGSFALLSGGIGAMLLMRRNRAARN